MTAGLIGQRTPVAIDDGLLRAGMQTASFDREQPETLLRNYLRLVRRARSQQRAPEISLRREDVEALAEYLGVTAESVLNRLATLMGSSRTQRTTMLATFASGALLIALAGSAAATSTPLDAAAPFPAEKSVELTSTEDISTAEVPIQFPTALEDVASSAIEVATIVGNAGQTSGGTAIVTDETSAELPRGSAPTLPDLGTFTPTSPAPSAPVPPAIATASNRQPAAVPPVDGDVDGLVALITPVEPDFTDVVAVGDALVPPSPLPSPDPVTTDAEVEEVAQPPTVTTIVPVDDIPQELPPVDDDTVAVGPPPVPPAATTPTTATAPSTTVP